MKTAVGGTARRIFRVMAAAMSALAVILAGLAFGETPAVATFTDKRDGKTYKKVTIGAQTWMAENLNFAAEGGKCYGNGDENCGKYGYLYDLAAARQACPSGWHLPSDDEWATLEDAVGGLSAAGKKLKSSEGWANNGNGTDDYGFSALPGGIGYSGGRFYNAGNLGYWWSATVYNASNAWYRSMYYGSEGVSRNYLDKAYLFAVRCAQD